MDEKIIPQTLGETLLSAPQLDLKTVKDAVEKAREEKRKAGEEQELDSLAVRLRFMVKLAGREKRLAEVKKIVTRILEIVE